MLWDVLGGNYLEFLGFPPVSLAFFELRWSVDGQVAVVLKAPSGWRLLAKVDTTYMFAAWCFSRRVLVVGTIITLPKRAFQFAETLWLFKRKKPHLQIRFLPPK